MKIDDSVNAFCVFYPDLDTASQRSSVFLDQGFHIATMPEIASIRAVSEIDSLVWNRFFTSATVEYFGLTQKGIPMYLVAHCIGPVDTISKANAFYNHKVKSSNHSYWSGMVLSREYFLKLENGFYGKVSAVNYVNHALMYKYPFCEPLKASQALDDPLVLARLGDSAQDYVEKHQKIAFKWQKDNGKRNVFDPWIMTSDQNVNMEYSLITSHKFDFTKYAMAHLLRTSNLVSTMYSECNLPMLANEIGPYQSDFSVRLLFIRNGTKPKEVVEIKD